MRFEISVSGAGAEHGSEEGDKGEEEEGEEEEGREVGRDEETTAAGEGSVLGDQVMFRSSSA